MSVEARIYEYEKITGRHEAIQLMFPPSELNETPLAQYPLTGSRGTLVYVRGTNEHIYTGYLLIMKNKESKKTNEEARVILGFVFTKHQSRKPLEAKLLNLGYSSKEGLINFCEKGLLTPTYASVILGLDP